MPRFFFIAKILVALGRAYLRFATVRNRGEPYSKILVVAPLLIGDSLMSVNVIAALRAKYPVTHITLVTSLIPAGVLRLASDADRVLTYEPASPQVIDALLGSGPYDAAYVLGENRYCLLAKAMAARIVIALADGRPKKYNFFLDVPIPIQPSLQNIYEQQQRLAGFVGAVIYDSRPLREKLPIPSLVLPTHYIVINLSASRKEKRLPADFWRELLSKLQPANVSIVLAVGPGEVELISSVDPYGDTFHYVGTSDFLDYVALIAGAKILISVDSGPVHVARLAGTPTVALYGPGGAALTGKPKFFASHTVYEMTMSQLPDKRHEQVFKRKLPIRDSGVVCTETEVIESVAAIVSRNSRIS